MNKFILSLCLLLQGITVGAQGISTINCILGSLNLNCLLPTPKVDTITFYAWIKSSNGVEEYQIQEGNETRIKEIFGDRRSIYVIFPGVGGTAKDEWIFKFKDAFMSNKMALHEVLISVDYKNFVTENTQAAQNVEMISQNCSEFIAWIYNAFSDSFYLYLFGHGMGAYIAGATSGKVKEIAKNYSEPLYLIGLDPDFLSPEALTLTKDNPPHINKSQAQIVIVLHTSTCSRMPPIEVCNNNTVTTTGHYDVFPNGGAVQPGCTDSTCSKNRATELLIEFYLFLLSPNELLAYYCPNFPTFLKGLCRNCATAGCSPVFRLNSYKNPYGRYYLATNAKSPFGKGYNQTVP